MRLELGDAVALRYRLVPGSTVRWVVRMDVDMTISVPDAPDETLLAMITSALDLETVRLEGQTALVRAYAHRSDFWVKGGTLSEDDVADPMAAMVPALLVDDLGSIVPLADGMAQSLAPPDSGDPGRMLLLALFPPYPEQSVQSAMQWEVGLHPSWSRTPDIAVACALARMERASDGSTQPVVLHGMSHEWEHPADGDQAFRSSGSMRFAAETRVDPRDGWAAHSESTGEIVATHARADGVEVTITTALKVVADRE